MHYYYFFLIEEVQESLALELESLEKYSRSIPTFQVSRSNPIAFILTFHLGLPRFDYFRHHHTVPQGWPALTKMSGLSKNQKSTFY